MPILEVSMLRCILAVAVLAFAPVVHAQTAVSFSYNENTDPMSRETTVAYAGYADRYSFNFFCDADGLNFVIGHDYLMYDSTSQLQWRVGDSEVSRISPNLISSSGDYLYFWGNQNFLSGLTNGIADGAEVLIRFFERSGDVQTFTLNGSADVFRLECALPLQGQTVEAEPSKPKSAGSKQQSRCQQGQVWVNGYTRRDGRRVNGYCRRR
jgi:hypothetical protein